MNFVDDLNSNCFVFCKNVQLFKISHFDSQEAKSYIKNIRKEFKFGEFKLAKAKTPFDPAKLDEYVAVMMNGNSPGANVSNNRNKAVANYGEYFVIDEASTGDESQIMENWQQRTDTQIVQDLLVDLTECDSPERPFVEQITTKQSTIAEKVVHVAEGAAEPKGKSVQKKNKPNTQSSSEPCAKKRRISGVPERLTEKADDIESRRPVIEIPVSASVKTLDWAVCNETMLNLKKSVGVYDMLLKEKIESQSRISELEKTEANLNNKVKVLEERIDKLMEQQSEREYKLRDKLKNAKAKYKEDVDAFNKQIEKLNANTERLVAKYTGKLNAKAKEHKEELKIKDEELARALGLFEKTQFKSY